jgi:hypothetical protein
VTDLQLLERVRFLKRLGLVALTGLVVLLGSATLDEGSAQNALIVIGILGIVPAFGYLVLLTAWHWKGRYRGTHSDLWGGILLLETSGWFKLVYLFRHIVPDAHGTGRYQRAAGARTV